VKVVDGSKLSSIPGTVQSSELLASFYAYAPAFTGGVFVAFGHSLTGPEVITGAGPGMTTDVKVLDATKLDQLLANSTPAPAAILGEFLAYDPSFTSGGRVGASDLNGDGVLDSLVAPGAGSPEKVKLVDGTKLALKQGNGEIQDAALIDQFFAFDPMFQDGVFVGGN